MRGVLRSILLPAALLLFASGAAHAAVAITIDKDSQRMTVAVDGAVRYVWPVSSGDPEHETPNGTFRTFRMEEDHYSKEFDDAPMPHAIFFTKQGHAIHGTDSVNRLGTPASHGCVRLSRANALKLWDLVKTEGLLNTTVTLTGSARTAVANGLRPRGADVARREAAPQPQYDAYGRPLQIVPQGARGADDDEAIDADSRSAASGYAPYGAYDAERRRAAQRPIYGAQRGGYVYRDGYGYRYDADTSYDDGYARPRSYYYAPRYGYGY